MNKEKIEQVNISEEVMKRVDELFSDDFNKEKGIKEEPAKIIKRPEDVPEDVKKNVKEWQQENKKEKKFSNVRDITPEDIIDDDGVVKKKSPEVKKRIIEGLEFKEVRGNKDKELKELTKKLEEKTPKERFQIGRGLINLGYLTQKWKSDFFSKVFEKASSSLIKEKGTIQESGTLRRFLVSYSELYKKESKQAQEMIKKSYLTKVQKGTSVLKLGSNVLRYGRIFYDLNYANPLRHIMAASMFIGRSAEVAKEARLKSAKVIEKTRIKDIKEAADEAWKIHEEAVKKIEQGKKVSKKDLDKAYRNFLPEDLKKRMTKKGVFSHSGLNVVRFFAEEHIHWSVDRINKKINKIDQNTKLSSKDKEIKKDKLLRWQEKKLKDLDGMVSQVGTIDLTAYLARVVEKTGKAASIAMMADTIYRLPQIFSNFTEMSIKGGIESEEKIPKVRRKIPLEKSAMPKDIAPKDIAPKDIAPKDIAPKEKLATIIEQMKVEKGNSSLSLTKKLYIQKAEELGYKPEMGDLKKWAERASVRHMVGQYIREHQGDYESLIKRIGQPPQDPIELDKWISKVSKNTFNEVLHDKVFNLVHKGDIVRVTGNGDILAFSPEGKPRIGHIAVGEKAEEISRPSADIPESSETPKVTTPGKETVTQATKTGPEAEVIFSGNEMKNIEALGFTPDEYKVIKDLKVGKLLKEISSKSKAWEIYREQDFSTIDLPHDGYYGPVEFNRHIKLAEYIRSFNISEGIKQMTIKQFLRMVGPGGKMLT